MSWLDPESIKKWKPVAFVFLLAGLIGATEKITGKVSDVWKHFSSDGEFSGTILAVDGLAHPDNLNFYKLLDSNLGDIIELDAVVGWWMAFEDTDVRDCYDRVEKQISDILQEFGAGNIISTENPNATILPMAVFDDECSITTIEIPESVLVRVFTGGHSEYYQLAGKFLVAHSESSKGARYSLIRK